MGKTRPLLTEFVDGAATAATLDSALLAAAQAAPAGPLAGMTPEQLTIVGAYLLFALGEVFEKQFYPCDRDQCQEVARELLARTGRRMPAQTIRPTR